jgi:DNA-binding transcriptional MerR regulator
MTQARVCRVQQRAHRLSVEQPAQLQPGHKRWQHAVTVRITGGGCYVIAALGGCVTARLYDPGQLDQARLIARLRRIGMPLAGIRTVCGLEHAAAAAAIDAYWQQVTADTAARGRLATFLVDDLSGRGTTMSDLNPTLAIRYATRYEAGAVRDSNEDTAYASDRLLAVADGGGGPRGATISRSRP